LTKNYGNSLVTTRSLTRETNLSEDDLGFRGEERGTKKTNGTIAGSWTRMVSFPLVHSRAHQSLWRLNRWAIWRIRFSTERKDIREWGKLLSLLLQNILRTGRERSTLPYLGSRSAPLADDGSLESGHADVHTVRDSDVDDDVKLIADWRAYRPFMGIPMRRRCGMWRWWGERERERVREFLRPTLWWSTRSGRSFLLKLPTLWRNSCSWTLCEISFWGANSCSDWVVREYPCENGWKIICRRRWVMWDYLKGCNGNLNEWHFSNRPSAFRALCHPWLAQQEVLITTSRMLNVLVMSYTHADDLRTSLSPLTACASSSITILRAGWWVVFYLFVCRKQG